MKPQLHPGDVVHRAASWAGVALDREMVRRLERFGDWLIDEARPAGGIGPGEAAVVASRHLADSLLFAYGWSSASRVLDAGSGVGLPGIPLAVVRPEMEMVLVDRSARRCRLAGRAVRILGLENVAIRRQEMSDVAESFEVVVSRAAVPPATLLEPLRRLVAPGGHAIIGGPAGGEDVPGYRTVRVPPAVLDRAASLLIMARA